MRPAGGSSVDREVEEAIRPFIRRRDVSRDRIDDEFVLPASASHGPR
jgi:hypothetical protein